MRIHVENFGENLKIKEAKRLQDEKTKESVLCIFLLKNEIELQKNNKNETRNR
jgi:hypothetical protein